MRSPSGLRNNWPPSRASRQIPGFPGTLASSPDDMTPEQRDPVSTIEGRSGFWATPNARRSIEVQLPFISPRVRAEYDRVSDVSRARSSVQASGPSRSASVASRVEDVGKLVGQAMQKSAAILNLNRFTYSGRGAFTAGVSASRNALGYRKGRDSKKPPKIGRVAKPANTGKKPRARGARDEKMRDRSSFARAVHHHFRRRTGNA